MNTTQCVVETKGKRCLEVFGSEEPLHPNVRFICKNHDRREQVLAAGRVYIPESDHKDAEVHFQDVQFDKELGRPSSEQMFDENGSAIPGAGKTSAKKII